MRGDFTLFLLETLQAGAATVEALAKALSSGKYGRLTYYKHFHGMPKEEMPPRPLFENRIHELRERQRVSKMLSKLKAEGLVSIKGEEWHATAAAKEKLNKLKRRLPSDIKGEVRVNGELKIITFDIPERNRAARHWLRPVLKNSGMIMLQKSVWAGNVALPEEFFDALPKLNLLTHVEVFAVTKTGTIRQLH